MKILFLFLKNVTVLLKINSQNSINETRTNPFKLCLRYKSLNSIWINYMFY